MAFRLLDYGIPNFDTNINVLYKKAVEEGESIAAGDEEYVCYKLGNTPLILILRYSFEADGETPKNCIMHTFLKNNVRWQQGVQMQEKDKALVQLGGAWLHAEIVNPTAKGSAYMPMLCPDAVRFGATRQTAGAYPAMQEGVIVPAENDGVELLARIKSVQPVVMSKLWLFSTVELETACGSLFLPVSRDIMEKQLQACNVGDLCYVTGALSLCKTWAEEKQENNA